MKYLNITYPDVNNGLGCRVTLWVSGCNHHCKGCHNSCSWDFQAGHEFTDDTKTELYNALNLPYIKGITLSGGDPLDSAHDIINLAQDIKNNFPSKDIWLYTGYLLEEIQNDSEKNGILSFVDYIVDGKFDISLKNTSLAFRGSSNQRIWQKEGDGFIEVNLD